MDEEKLNKRCLRILNKTRYRTKDIARIVEVSGERVGWPLTVDYYQPSKRAKEMWADVHAAYGAPRGLFVKLQRNGDEQNYVGKGLNLIKPTRFDGASELEQLAAMSGEAPHAVIYQILHRLYLMRRWHREDKGPDWRSAVLNSIEVGRYRELVDKHGLKLRFNDKDPSEEVVEWREMVVNQRSAVIQSRSNVKSTKRSISNIEDSIRRYQRSLESNQSELAKHEAASVSAKEGLERLLADWPNGPREM
jgi:hypothetical protein